ncbi:MAG: DUF1934 domain-containing protein [Lachnospiraceae bacterium]|nr:DUF1934 domain-containing protein [Lachnospiraceae bacterium]
MTKDVLISLCTVQSNSGETQEDRTQTLISGNYYEKNGRHYIFYDEVMEGVSKAVKTNVKISENMLEIIRSGPIGVRMLFEENKKNVTSYNTPYGNILLGISTKKINVTVQPDIIEIDLEYTLDADGGHLSDCSMNMKIQSKNII